MFKYFRKKLRIPDKELDDFLHNKSTSTKYYVEKTYLKNKVFLYLVLLRLNGVNLNAEFDQMIKDNFEKDENNKWKIKNLK
jgi:hypothetical protein